MLFGGFHIQFFNTNWRVRNCFPETKHKTAGSTSVSLSETRVNYLCRGIMHIQQVTPPLKNNSHMIGSFTNLHRFCFILHIQKWLSVIYCFQVFHREVKRSSKIFNNIKTESKVISYCGLKRILSGKEMTDFQDSYLNCRFVLNIFILQLFYFGIWLVKQHQRF